MCNKAQTSPHVNKSRDKARERTLKEFRASIQEQTAEFEDESERAKYLFVAEAGISLNSDDFMRVYAEVYGKHWPKGGAK